MRLIDADKPRKTLVDWLNWYKGSEAVKSVVREAVDVLDETPTIEAEPVRHGKWEAVCCSCCGHDLSSWADAAYEEVAAGNIHRCPNCGAKMDLEG